MPTLKQQQTIVPKLIKKMKAGRSGRPLKLKRVPRPASTKPLERAYLSDLLEMIGFMSDQVEGKLVPKLSQISKKAAAVRPPQIDRMDDYTDDVEKIMKSIRDGFYREYDEEEIAFFAEKAADRGEKFNAKNFQRQFKAVFGIEMPLTEPYLESTIKNFVTQNVSLIQSIPDVYFDRVESLVLREVQAGTLTDEIADQIEEAYEVSESKATLIARDQTSKLNGNLNQMRQTEVGVSKYQWSTSIDERVRESHSLKEGQIFEWSDPPSDTGHPGEDFQCRCTAIPVFDDFPEEPTTGPFIALPI